MDNITLQARLINALSSDSARKHTYDEHSNQQVLLGDLSVGEDVVEHVDHVTFVFLAQCEHTFVIVSC